MIKSDAHIGVVRLIGTFPALHCFLFLKTVVKSLISTMFKKGCFLTAILQHPFSLTSYRLESIKIPKTKSDWLSMQPQDQICRHESFGFNREIRKSSVSNQLIWSSTEWYWLHKVFQGKGRKSYLIKEKCYSLLRSLGPGWPTGSCKMWGFLIWHKYWRKRKQNFTTKNSLIVVI